MQTQKDIENTDFYSFRADANVLGGFLEWPIPKSIPTLAPVSLPAVGGSTTASSEGFTLDSLVSCGKASSHVDGRVLEDGTITIESTAVVEDLNILDVVRAERIVARLSIWIKKGEGLKVSTVGSTFEGFRVGDCRRNPWLNEELQCFERSPDGAARADAERIGALQVRRINQTFADRPNAKWADNRSKWLNGVGKHGAGCSVVDGFEDQRDYGHILDIPGFGRIFLGELFISPGSAQLVSIRAELGCPVKGKITVNCSGGGGVHD
jgi:hypothetical protein